MTQSESGKDKDRRHQADWPLELSEVSYQFYRKETSAKETEKGKELEATPTKPSTSGALPSLPPSASAGTTTAPGLTTIHTGPLTGEKTPVEVLSDLIEEYSLPDEEKFELFCRVRVAWALAKGRQEEREYLVRARLLAIAIYGGYFSNGGFYVADCSSAFFPAHTQDESHAQSDFFLYEPELIPHIAQLIHPDRSVPIQVQTSAVVALDGLGRYRTKISEVLTAVNSGVSHGILMGQVRRAVAELARPECTCYLYLFRWQSPADLDNIVPSLPLALMPGEFADALLAFIVYLTSNPAGGTMIVGAGLVPLLVQLLNNHLPSRLHVCCFLLIILAAADSQCLPFADCFADHHPH
jgi:E3 ubiquitin-protein ligase HUWE1